MVTQSQRLLGGIFGLLALSLPAHAAEVDKFLPDHTEALVTINVKQLLHGGLMKKIGLEPLQQSLKDCDECKKILESLGVDPFADLDRVTIAAAVNGDKPFGVVIIHGRFDTAEFQKGAKALATDHDKIVKMHKAGDRRYYEVVATGEHGSFQLGAGFNADKTGATVPVFAFDGKGSPLDLPGSFYFGLVDKGTLILASQKEALLDSFDRAESPKKPTLKKSVRRAIEECDFKQSMWIVARLSVLTEKDATGDSEEPEEPNRISALTGGVTIGDDVKIHFTLTAVNIDAAKDVMKDLDDLRTRLTGLATLLSGTQKDCACLKDVPKAITATRKGKTISIECTLDADLMEQLAGLLQKME
jgi:hypothetical protein